MNTKTLALFALLASPAELQRLKPPPARRDHVDRCLARMRAALREAGA